MAGYRLREALCSLPQSTQNVSRNDCYGIRYDLKHLNGYRMEPTLAICLLLQLFTLDIFFSFLNPWSVIEVFSTLKLLGESILVSEGNHLHL
jgi:hypothetical protein